MSVNASDYYYEQRRRPAAVLPGVRSGKAGRRAGAVPAGVDAQQP